MNPSGPGGGFRPVKPTLCRYFSANGYCFYGDQCQFLHAKSANENRQGNAPFHRSSSTPVFPSSNGPIGAQGHRVYKGNNAMNQQAQENMIHNFSGLSFSAKGQVPQSNAMAQMHNSHVSPLSPTKKSFSSSLAPGGPISPLHSPKPNQPKLKSMQLQPSSSSYEFLPNTTNQHQQQQQQQQQPFNPESIDGTMYFYPQQNHNQPSVVLPSYHAVVSEPAHLAHLQNNQTRNNAFSMSAQLRQELMNQHALSMAQLDSDDPSVPKEVDSYHSLCPLEPLDTPPDQGQRTFGYTTTCYKAVNSKDGLLYVLRRVNGYRLVNAKSMVVVDQWKKITHSNIVNLREVFTTKAFSDSSLVFVYDYHPGAETLLSRHFSGPDSTLPLNPDGSLAFPRPGMPGPSGRSRHGGLMPEKLIWSYIIQLSSALRVIHSAGLACRMIDPSKILLIGNSRLRINGCGIFDILSFDPGNSPNAIAPHFQQEDLTSLGKLVLALASCYSLQSIQREHIQQALEYVAMNYSADLKNLIIYLLGSPPPTLMKSVNDIMPMIGARFYTQLEAAQVKCDVLEGELAKEMENGRILRILSKLGTINERPELGMDHNWSETGDRYLLKLFRDYLFHSVTDNGSPTVDLSHIVTCLNKLDSGTTEKVCLMSRDEQSVLVVSYRDLRNCFEGAFNEILAASLS